MDNYSGQLKNQLSQLEELIAKTESSLKVNRTLDERKVRVCKQKTGYQYYLQEQDGRRTYVKVQDIETVKRILQREYDLEVKEILTSLKKSIDRFLRVYDPDLIEKAYDRLSDGKKVLVTPVIKADDEYIQAWENANQGGKNPFPEQGQYLTERGEYVRSKSEKILADLFYKYAVPYSYEPQLDLSGRVSLYPDFAVLNVKKRKTIYWEHFGLTDNEDYARKAFQKLAVYEKNGMEVGNNLLYSVESETTPLDVRQIERKILRYLK